eukprot:TRINITY_DN21463_c0_g1_i2.p1 TRINITY_DN21463_c0_g1~~TRINITY_DN21463_c0_g1_i2.p1  ORF type:complete len:787 (-),score=137.63 TRINITY_DN21463_c0_g1_i2:390-2444(-)
MNPYLDMPRRLCEMGHLSPRSPMKPRAPRSVASSDASGTKTMTFRMERSMTSVDRSSSKATGSDAGEANGERPSSRKRISRWSSMNCEPAKHPASSEQKADEGEAQDKGLARAPTLKRQGSMHPHTGFSQWSWEHRTGFRPYDQAANYRIEDAFWNGEERVRLKSGKDGAVPMEIWFADMIQYDPKTSNKRRVQRDPPPNYWLRARRFVLSHMHGKRSSFAQYEKLRNELVNKWDAKRYDDARFYRDGTRCARLAQSLPFAFLSSLAAVFSTIWIGVDAELNDATSLFSSDLQFQAVEYMFACFFAFELAVRFGAFKSKLECIFDPWFRLDAALVLLSLVEVLIFPILVYSGHIDISNSMSFAGNFTSLRLLRLLRLARIGRVARLLRQVPAMVIMTKGVIAAGGSVAITFTMMISLLYVFAIIFKMQAEEHPQLAEELFPSLGASMQTLLIHGAFMDSPSKVMFHPDVAGSFFLYVAFLTFVFLSCFVVLNLLVGVLCDVVAEVSQQEKEDSDILFLRSTVSEMLPCYDRDDDEHLCKEEIELLLQNSEMRVALNRFGVNVQGLVLSLDMYLENLHTDGLEERLSYHEFLEFVMRLRAVKHTTVLDIVDLRDYLRQRLDALEQRMTSGETPCRLSGAPTARFPPAMGVLGDNAASASAQAEQVALAIQREQQPLLPHVPSPEP